MRSEKCESFTPKAAFTKTLTMKLENVTILGGGNLGIAIARGLAKSNFIDPGKITVTRRRIHLLYPLEGEGISITSDNVRASKEGQVLILAVQPRQIKGLLEEILPVLNPKKHILVSVITGVTIDKLREMTGPDFPIFRAMPNTAIAIQESMTCISTDSGNEAQKELISSIFNKLGKSLLVEEILMDAATVLGASGIAFAMRYIRAQSQGGIEIGFDAAEAQMIAAQTVKGAAGLLLTRGRHPEGEIDKVTTPQGCTIAGLNEMEHQGFSSALIKGISTSYKKISKIGKD